MNKRSHSTAFEGPKLRIKLASTGDLDAAAAAPLGADAYLVRMYSAVAMQLPETDKWDLRGLLVSRDTVVAWLNAAYQNTYETDFEEQEDSPACNADGLYRLLAFADAVDSTRPLLKACCAGLQRLQLSAQLGEQQVSLQLDGRSYAFNNKGMFLERRDILSDVEILIPPPLIAADAEQQAAFAQQVAAQTEQLLWLAYRLQLQPLMQQLHAFIQPNCRMSTAVLDRACGDVFTPRVLEVAGVAGLPGGKQMLMNSVLGEVAQLSGVPDEGAQTLLQPHGLTQGQQQPIKFNAVVMRSGLWVAPGSTVPVELDLFGKSQIRLGWQLFPVQLRIGRYVQPDS